MDRTTFVPMDEKHLSQFGENTARAMRPEGEMRGTSVFFETLAALQEIRTVRDRAASRGENLSDGSEWLLDNWYLAQREGREGAEAFRKTKGLRYVLREGRRPLIMELSRAFVWAAGSDTSLPRLDLFLACAQAYLPLTEQELSLLVPSLKCALVERLSLLCKELEHLNDVDGDRLAVGMASVFTALRTLANSDLSDLVEKSSKVEEILRGDPAGVYAEMDDETRRRYRQQVCRLAKKEHRSEPDMAEEAINQSARSRGETRHVGFHLFARKPNEAAGALYVGGVVVVSLFFALLAGFWVGSVWAALLLLLPMSDIVKNCADFLTVRLVQPRPVHRMALRDGVPHVGRTLCVIATLLTSEAGGAGLTALLEQYRLANRDAGQELRFGLLADLPDRDRPMGEEEQRWVEGARTAVDRLNAKYGGGFYLFFRQPVFHTPDERYMGWERKRGALIELVRLLRNRRSGLTVPAGDRAWLREVKYVITLDSDTSLNVGAARELVGAMLHPLNTPIVDQKRNMVVSGYGLLQPRISVELESANRSHFSRIFAGQGGVDPYGSAASDVYHDLFDEGTYTGKGIFDADVFFSCLDRRLPKNTVLSHDLLEGSYLRAGLIGDVELTDGYPYKVTSYFSRLHRWVRGDWQLLPWLGRWVRNEMGEKVRNPITPMARWKLLDNLRRSLSPVFTLLALLLGACLSGPAFAVAAGTAVLSAGSHLLLSGADLAFRRGKGLAARYHSTIIAGFGGVLLQTLVQLLLLPHQAWVCGSAALTALWRSGFSHHRLLAWTTAAEAEGQGGNTLWAYYKKLWPLVAAGLFCVAFALLPAGAAGGLIWTATPLFAWAMSQPIGQGRSVKAEDRPFLLHQAALIWGYFTEFLGPKDHWLPPDNWQEHPAVGLARRTSPTNIGMALLCCLAAVDLKVTTREKAVDMLRHMLDTLEHLPKWRGHLYNWYDTESAAPLEPRYVSTVDGGNLCGCLIALREGLSEWGEISLAQRAGVLADAMDFSLLYDKTHRLFYIGYDCGKESFTQGWYDLMASEARQTSYLAVARGEVEPRHWRRLSRMLVTQDNYSGMASWTGTMFEYFMPHLLLPAYPNSLLYESLAFCVYAQKKRTAGTDAPWGISESGFYAFDGSMSYQYKAHGIQRLGLKRGLGRELVISPYATFLALSMAPRSAGRNLRRLRDLGMEGPYGLYEAADFTPGRRTGLASFEPVRSYMVHHLGMSMLAIDNALNGEVMQVRFMRDAAMSAYRELLQEKVPVGAQAMKAPRREVPEKPHRDSGAPFQRQGVGFQLDQPNCHLVSGGAWRVLCTDAGAVQSRMGKTALTRCVWNARNQPSGVSFFLRTHEGLLPLTPAPLYREGPSYSWSFDGGGGSWTASWKGYLATLRLRVPERENGELWDVSLRWTGEGTQETTLVCYLEPVLAHQEDYDAHPAFSKLSIESAALEDGVLFTRRAKRRAESRPALAVLWDSRQATFDTSRETGLGRGGLMALETALERPAQSSVGQVLDPCLLVRFPVTLERGETAQVRVALSAADSGAAENAALRLLRMTERAEDNGTDRLMASLSMTSEKALQSFSLLSRLQFPNHPPVRKGSAEQRALWPFGISGDLPMAALDVADEGGVADAMNLAKYHQFLTLRGFSFDLVLLLSEGGDYRHPVRDALEDGLRALDWLHELGARGGVHLVETGTAAETERITRLSVVLGPGLKLPETRRSVAVVRKDIPFAPQTDLPSGRFEEDGTFAFETGAGLPLVGWSMMLCNEEFGWMTDETGGGHLWFQNAKENPLTPWKNDPLAVGGPEELTLRADGEERSFFSYPDGLPCTVRYAPGVASWKKTWGTRRLHCTSFVPPSESARYLLLETGDGEIVYRREGVEERVWPIEGRLCLRTTLVSEAAKTQPYADWTAAEALRKATVAWWKRRVNVCSVHSPDPALDHYLNGWGLYQVISCRLFGRTSLYQNGGAFGFRDQLQDACAVLAADPALARKQILRACAHQYREGDVQHWWHPGVAPEKGVRTRISDDLLWLPYTLCVYVEQTGDSEILTRKTTFLVSPLLAEGERERYEGPEVSEKTVTVLEHATRAVDLVLERGYGPHSLVKMGTGDWNDGMDLVGAGGSGESVWLTWFLSKTLLRLAPHCGDQQKTRYLAEAEHCVQGANAAWDGAWFLRGWYDNGETLGSRTDEECQIDSIAQSFAALCPGADPEKAETAVCSALERLFDRDRNVVQLFTPPFDDGARDPGYIRGYLPGVRENGGQYTHAAVWLALACFRQNKPEEGFRILKALLPISHDQTVYRAEPYVLAADVYSNPQHRGRGGWSWYTGAAGWYVRVATEELLGLKRKGGALFLAPKLPSDWPGYTADWTTETAVLHIQVQKNGPIGTFLDGKLHTGGIPLGELTGEHSITVGVEGTAHT